MVGGLGGLNGQRQAARAISGQAKKMMFIG
jgi:hypothetical protein